MKKKPTCILARLKNEIDGVCVAPLFLLFFFYSFMLNNEVLQKTIFDGIYIFLYTLFHDSLID